MLWEILLILVALPILEGIGWLIADAIEARVTWKPFKSYTNKRQKIPRRIILSY